MQKKRFVALVILFWIKFLLLFTVKINLKRSELVEIHQKNVQAILRTEHAIKKNLNRKIINENWKTRRKASIWIFSFWNSQMAVFEFVNREYILSFIMLWVYFLSWAKSSSLVQNLDIELLLPPNLLTTLTVDLFAFNE